MSATILDSEGNVVESYDTHGMPAVSYVAPASGRRRVVVANFSSPHSFKFTNGVTLAACSDARAEMLKARSCHSMRARADGLFDAYVGFEATDALRRAFSECVALWDAGGVDIVVAPLLTIDVFVLELGYERVLQSPFRTIVRSEAAPRSDAGGPVRCDAFGMPRRAR